MPFLAGERYFWYDKVFAKHLFPIFISQCSSISLYWQKGLGPNFIHIDSHCIRSNCNLDNEFHLMSFAMDFHRFRWIDQIFWLNYKLSYGQKCLDCSQNIYIYFTMENAWNWFLPANRFLIAMPLIFRFFVCILFSQCAWISLKGIVLKKMLNTPWNQISETVDAGFFLDTIIKTMQMKLHGNCQLSMLQNVCNNRLNWIISKDTKTPHTIFYLVG